MNQGVIVSNDCGTWVVYDWRELMICIFQVLAHAIYLDMNGGKCRCGCDCTDCNYCSYECF